MSKRQCISLLHLPHRTLHPLPQCRLRHLPSTTQPKPLQPRTRPFSSTSRHPISSARQATSRPAAQPSIAVSLKTQQKLAQDSGTVLEHVGLLDGTFIPPTGTNLPSPWTDLRGRLKLEWYGAVERTVTPARNWLQGFWMVRPRARMAARREVERVARGLYERMNAHFARGDIGPVEGELAAGLAGRLRARMARRGAGESLVWTLQGYVGRARMVSRRFAVMPGQKNTEAMGIEQAVVRVRSRQSLVRMQKRRVMRKGRTEVENVPVDEQGKEIGKEHVEEYKRRTAKDTTEYVVVQRLLKKSRFGPWQLWGTAEETTLDKINNEEKAHSERALKAAQAHR